MSEIIEKAINDYWRLDGEIRSINAQVHKPSLKELPGMIGLTVEQDDIETNNLIDVSYGNIYVTIYQPEGFNSFEIGTTVEVFDDSNNYIRDLTDEEITK